MEDLKSIFLIYFCSISKYLKLKCFLLLRKTLLIPNITTVGIVRTNTCFDLRIAATWLARRGSTAIAAAGTIFRTPTGVFTMIHFTCTVTAIAVNRAVAGIFNSLITVTVATARKQTIGISSIDQIITVVIDTVLTILGHSRIDIRITIIAVN